MAYSPPLWKVSLELPKPLKGLFTSTTQLRKTSKLLSIELIKANPIDQSHFERFNKSEAKFINWIKAAQEDKKLTCSHSAELIASQFHSIMKGEIFYPALFGMNEITNSNLTTCKEVSWSFIKNYLL